MLDICITVYLDNILIYSNNKEQYQKQVKEVFQYLCKPVAQSGGMSQGETHNKKFETPNFGVAWLAFFQYNLLSTLYQSNNSGG